MRSTQCPQACSKTCPKTSSQASEISISKTAHFAASTKMENREFERRIQRRQNAPVNHRQPAKTLHEKCSQSACLYSAFYFKETDITLCDCRMRRACPPLKKLMIPKFTVVSHKQLKFRLQNKVLLKTKLIIFLSIEQGIPVQNLKCVASLQLE